jgi:hypothetical protein
MKKLRERDYDDTILKLNNALLKTMDHIIGRKYHQNMVRKATMESTMRFNEIRKNSPRLLANSIKLQTNTKSYEYENIDNRKRAVHEELNRFMKKLISTDYRYSKRHFLNHLYHNNQIDDILNIMKYMNLRGIDNSHRNETIYEIIRNSHKNHSDIPDEHRELLNSIRDVSSSLSSNVINRYETLSNEKRKLIDTMWHAYKEHIMHRSTREKRRNNSPFGEKTGNWTGFDDPSPYVINDLPDLLPLFGFIGSWILRLDNSYNTTGCNPGLPLLPEQSATCFYPVFLVSNFTVGPPGFDFFNPQCGEYLNPIFYGKSFILTFTTPIFGRILQKYPGWGLTGPFAPFPFGYFVWNATGGIGFNALPPYTIPCLYVYQLWIIVYGILFSIIFSIFIIGVFVWQRVQEKLFIRPLVGRTRVVIGKFNELTTNISDRVKAGSAKGLDSIGNFVSDIGSGQPGRGGSKLKSPFGKGGFKIPKMKLPKVKIPKIPLKFR